MRLRPTPWMAGMLSSMTSTWVGTAQAPSSCTRRKALAASRTRKATAASSARSGRGGSSGARWALTMTLMSPWRYSSTSRERWRATGRKPRRSRLWPSSCGRAVLYSMNSSPSSPSGLGSWLRPSRDRGRSGLAVIGVPRAGRGSDLAGGAQRQQLVEVALDAVGVGLQAGEQLEGPQGLAHGHAAAVADGATQGAGRAQQLGLEREIHHLGH